MTVDSMKVKLNAPFVRVWQVRNRTHLQSPLAINSTNIFGYNLISVKGRTFLRTFSREGPQQQHSFQHITLFCCILPGLSVLVLFSIPHSSLVSLLQSAPSSMKNEIMSILVVYLQIRQPRNELAVF